MPGGGLRLVQRLHLQLQQLADELGCDYFTTTLSISPHKNAAKLNEIGEELAGITKARHLPSDFKKRGGYQRSIQLSGIYQLYRQDFCGCIYSRREAEQRRIQKVQTETA